MEPLASESGKIPRVFITPQALQRLKLYIDLCPFEVGGLGIVEPFGEDLLVADIFLLRQRASDSDTELDPQAIADHLLQTIREGKDPSSLRLWWHSHAEGDISWSDTDKKTIEAFEAFQIEELVSIVGNKRHEFGCRLDRFSPERFIFDKLPFLPTSDEKPDDEESLRKKIMAELREKVTLFHRDISLIPEDFLDPSSTLEIPIPFTEQQSPQQD
jgi:hypothetical protein